MMCFQWRFGQRLIVAETLMTNMFQEMQQMIQFWSSKTREAGGYTVAEVEAIHSEELHF